MVSQIFKKAKKRSIPQHVTHAKRTQFRVAELGVGYGGWQVASATSARNGTGRSGYLRAGVHQVLAEEWLGIVASGLWSVKPVGGR